MNIMNRFPIIDGHNDTLLKLHLEGCSSERLFFSKTSVGHIDLPRARRGGFSAGFFAIFCPNSSGPMLPDFEEYMTEDGYDFPLPQAVDYDYCNHLTNAMVADLYRLEADANEKFKVLRTADELEELIHIETVGAILHFEGAESIDKDLNALHVFYQAGLRSLGLVWSRPNVFAEGVPYRYPSTPDIGSGLTEPGKKLVQECNKLGIMLDLSHLNEKGFWDVMELSDAPLVATHSNAHAICPISRNLTDKQLDAIADSNGVVGVTYAVNMLRPDGKLDTDTPLEMIVKHIEYIADRIGIEHVSLGSDFDGTTIPDELGDVTGVPKVVKLLKDRGFSDDDLSKLTSGNWMRVLKETWK
ncbi:dipeptidase [Halobacillus naozhouensis]|uniref:Dipeptidase n=1 Tax=Halobacillus naozhouensis TaxID=554880 RepID=A0ABY8IZP5_9BACI|nr:dipeptidase [Halobacillus naozhouensis]WFT74847.1 dipeptidase [Halobacillus naozhouensis]